jgi:hypothetical protein
MEDVQAVEEFLKRYPDWEFSMTEAHSALLFKDAKAFLYDRGKPYFRELRKTGSPVLRASLRASSPSVEMTADFKPQYAPKWDRDSQEDIHRFLTNVWEYIISEF